MKMILALLTFVALGLSAVRADRPADIKRNLSICRGTLGSVQRVEGRTLVLPSRGVNLNITRSRLTGGQHVTLTQQSTGKRALFTISAGGSVRIRNSTVRNLRIRPPVLCVLPD